MIFCIEYLFSEGGHNIPEETIRRRYIAGLKNLFEIYLPICDTTLIFNNSDNNEELVYKMNDGKEEIYNYNLFIKIKI